MTWFSKKNNLDEMQELKLLKIESKGFWIGFIGLFLAIMAQIFLFGQEYAGNTRGEFVIFLCMGIWLVGGCLRNGIWDRHLKASPAVNIGLSILAAFVTALFNAVVSYRNYQSMSGAFAVFIVYFLMTGTLLSVTLCTCTALYHRRRKRLEEENEDDAD